MTRSTSVVSIALLGLSLQVGCIVRGGTAHPLYPGAERPAEEVARLVGPIGEVDGQDVKHLGKAFSLLPGCHVVKLAPKTGELSKTGTGGYVANLPGFVYPFRMQAGHTYEIEVVLDSVTGPTGTLSMRAWDRDEHGGALELSPAKSTAEIDDCLKWHP